jgi:hypothetical protein
LKLPGLRNRQWFSGIAGYRGLALSKRRLWWWRRSAGHDGPGLYGRRGLFGARTSVTEHGLSGGHRGGSAGLRLRRRQCVRVNPHDVLRNRRS